MWCGSPHDRPCCNLSQMSGTESQHAECNGNGHSIMESSIKEPLLKNLSDPPVPERWKRRLKPLQKYMKDHDTSPVTWLGLAVFFGILCGIVAFVYSTYFNALLWLVWQVSATDLPVHHAPVL